jgi:hypothetical protein
MGRPLPTFPAEFYTGIDVAITNKGYGYTVYEAFDSSCQAVVQEVFLPTKGHTRYLYDYRGQKLWTVRSGNGGVAPACTARPLDAGSAFVHEDGLQLSSAARFLSYHKDSKYIPRAKLGNPIVRCAAVSCRCCIVGRRAHGTPLHTERHIADRAAHRV